MWLMPRNWHLDRNFWEVMSAILVTRLDLFHLIWKTRQSLLKELKSPTDPYHLQESPSSLKYIKEEPKRSGNSILRRLSRSRINSQASQVSEYSVSLGAEYTFLFTMVVGIFMLGLLVGMIIFKYLFTEIISWRCCQAKTQLHWKYIFMGHGPLTLFVLALSFGTCNPEHLIMLLIPIFIWGWNNKIRSMFDYRIKIWCKF